MPSRKQRFKNKILAARHRDGTGCQGGAQQGTGARGEQYLDSPARHDIMGLRILFGTSRATKQTNTTHKKNSLNRRPVFRSKRTFTIEARGKRTEYKLPKLTLGEWHDIKYHVRYDTNANGFVRAWFDGRQVVDYHGPTAEPGYKNAFYHKMGLYRDRIPQPMTAYFDDFKMILPQPDTP